MFDTEDVGVFLGLDVVANDAEKAITWETLTTIPLTGTSAQAEPSLDRA
jgi:hypothetical protein